MAKTISRVGGRVFRLALLSIVVAGLAGCTAMSGPAKVQNFQTSEMASFPGLLPSTHDRVSKRYIFQIHGINTPDPDWGEKLLGQIPAYGYVRERTPGSISCYADGDPRQAQPKLCNPAKLKISHTVTGQGVNCDGNSADRCVYDRFGVYHKDVFTNAKTGDRVTVYTYFWRGDLWRVTGHFLQSDIDANDISSWRPNTRKSFLNAWIKSGLIDNGLSDAAGYLSRLGTLEREGTESALCAMFADAIGTPEAAAVPPGSGCLDALSNDNHLDPASVEFNFLSHSLGSRMLYDVLSPYEPETHNSRAASANEARSFIANSSRTFFMAANQLPLLAVSGVRISGESSAAPSVSSESAQPLANFLALRSPSTRQPSKSVPFDAESRPVQSPELVVIDFQDPDDLLGFKASDVVLNGEATKANKVRFVDVLHRNTPQWLFVFANPLKAHDQELVEPHSLKMILCGARANAAGTLTPNDCIN